MAATADTEVRAFSGERLIATGRLAEIMPSIWEARESVLVFEATSARPVEVDLRGHLEEAAARVAPAAIKKPGRPKLGVTAREVTLLPKHWDWLATQPGGASVALRKLVENAMRDPANEVRLAKEAAYRFMTAMAGNCANFDEANRALFAGDRRRFEEETKNWPPDLRAFTLDLAANAFDSSEAA